MGRRFVATCGPRGKLYGCKKCFTYLTCHEELSSPHFTGSTGPAMLFRRAWNIGHGEVERRKMTTGWHVVRDVFCILCKAKLGWMYEMALENDQVYKERQVIFENALICKISENISDPLGDDKSEPTNNRPNLERRQHTPRSPYDTSRLSSRSNSESGSAGSVTPNAS